MATYGPYETVAELGRGGMGVVWRAIERESGRPVALKTVTVATPAMLASIRTEVRALAALDHPGLARILGAGDEGGRPWLALELVEGTTLRERLPATEDAATTFAPGDDPWGRALRPDAAPAAVDGLERADALRLVARLCRTLAYLHGRGIVHRDLKPENVIVRPDGRPVLVDFGLVHRAHLAREVLEAGVDGGTPLYAAPEQLAGEPADARSDLYSVGCVLYELLTGAPPFRGTDWRQVAARHATEAPVPPSELVEGIDPRLDELVLRLLAKSPAARPGYAGDVAGALSALAGDDPEPGPLPVASTFRPRLVGRDDALGTLLARLDAVAAGEGGLVVLAGESGGGKTRLAAERARRARASATVVSGSCDPAALAPFAPFRAALAALAARDPACLGEDGPVLASFVPGISAPPASPLPPALERARALRALGAVLGRAASARPLVLLLDDLQWADELSFELLGEHAAAPIGRVLLVGTCRTDEGDRAEALRAAGATVLALGGLDAAGVARLVGDVLADPSPPEALVAALAARSGGNPFYVAEVLRELVASGELVRDADGTWSSVDPDELAPTPAEAAARRIASLPAGARSLAGTAALLGRAFPTAMLLEVTGGGDEVLDDLRILRLRDVLDEPAPGALRFAHDRLAEAAERAVDPARAAELHERAARCWSAVPEPTGDLQARIAHHLERAGRSGEAIERYVAAAELLARGLSVDGVLATIDAALRLDPSPAQRARLLERRAGVLERLGRIEEGVATARELVACCEATGDVAMLAQATSWWSHFRAEAGALAEAEELGRKALALAVGTPVIALVLDSLGTVLLRRGAIAEARVLLEEAVARHEARGDRRDVARARSRLAGVYVASGDLEPALAMEAAALRELEVLGDVFYRAIALSNVGAISTDLGRIDEALAAFEQAIALHRAAGNTRSEGIARLNRGQTWLELGRHDEARGELRLAIERARACGDGATADFCEVLLATADVRDGLAGVPERVVAVLERQRANGYDGDLSFTLRALAEARRAAGELGPATAAAREAHAAARAAGAALDEALAACELGLCCVIGGDRALAATLLDEARSYQRTSAPGNRPLASLVEALSAALTTGSDPR